MLVIQKNRTKIPDDADVKKQCHPWALCSFVSWGEGCRDYMQVAVCRGRRGLGRGKAGLGAPQTVSRWAAPQGPLLGVWVWVPFCAHQRELLRGFGEPQWLQCLLYFSWSLFWNCKTSFLSFSDCHTSPRPLNFVRNFEEKCMSENVLIQIRASPLWDSL